MRMGLIDNAFHTHNIYTDALSETGIIGFMIFLIAYFYFAINFLFSGYKENNFLSISAGWIIVMILISGFFEKNLDRAIIDLLIFSIMGLARAKKPPIEQ
jgi:O-antigen ligase